MARTQRTSARLGSWLSKETRGERYTRQPINTVRAAMPTTAGWRRRTPTAITASTSGMTPT